LKKRDSRFYENKSQYIVGFGVGTSLASLVFGPIAGQSDNFFKTRNFAGFVTGAAIMIIGGIYGSIARRKEKNG
jgi:hypothetical protein